MKYVIANWKMNMELKDLIEWAEGFDASIIPADITVILAPSFPHLFPAKEMFKNTQLKISSQDTSVELKGAHTGDVGAFQLKEFCEYAIVGHSERREFAETVVEKARLCLSFGITPIICFSDLSKINVYRTPGAIYAWEDPNNISKNGEYREKKPAEIEKGVSRIRGVLSSGEVLLYGGSVNGQNIPELVKIGKLDGVLVGNASINPKHFSEIIAAYSK